ncbi:hypothetical protein [Actinomycetospora chlora]|uniref:hypothetical protein n=1 Tax=Actinomycetospora chlora TaxID=663608 RepID=UPI0031F19CD4
MNLPDSTGGGIPIPEDDRRPTRRTPPRSAADGTEAAARRSGDGHRAEAASRPDVYLDVPRLEVEHIGLEVEDLRAKVSLQAEVLNLLKLNVGVDAQLGKVALEIDGVQAEATLKVRLDEVAGIIDRVLTTIDRNPQILETIARTAQDAVQEVGSGVGDAVGELGQQAGQAVGELGQQAGGAVGELGQQAGDAVGQVGEQAGDAVGQAGDDAAASTTGSGSGSDDRPAEQDQGGRGQGGRGGGRSPRFGATSRPRAERRATG